MKSQRGIVDFQRAESDCDSKGKGGQYDRVSELGETVLQIMSCGGVGGSKDSCAMERGRYLNGRILPHHTVTWCFR